MQVDLRAGDSQALSQEPDCPAGLDLRSFATEVSRLYASVESADFINALQRFLDPLVSFDYMTIFSQRELAPPKLVWSSFRPSVIRTGVRNYVEETHVLDPYVRALRSGAPEGAYRGSDMGAFLASNLKGETALPIQVCDQEELGFRTADWPEFLAELQVVFATSGGDGETVCCQIGLYRDRDQPAFSKKETCLLTAMTPIISGSFSRFWRHFHGIDEVPGEPPVFDILSPRERSVIRLVSQGFSSSAIGELLQVSLETVKTHRKRAYRKLSICSQSELLALMQPLSRSLQFHS